MKNNSIIKIVVSYFIFSTVWIKLSDTLLGFVVTDLILLTKIQTYKGLAFVILSTLLIFSLLLKETRKREKEEKEKRKYFNMIQAIIDNSKFWIFIKKLNGEYLLTNSKFLEDIKENNIKGKLTEEVFSESLKYQLKKTDNEVINHGAGEPFEFNYNNKTYLCTKFPVDDENNSATLIGGIASDVTQLKTLHRDSLLIKQVFENSKDGIILFDHHFKITKSNQAFCEITLFESKEIIGSNISSLDSELDSHNLISKISIALPDMNEWRGELWLRKKNGEIFPCWAVLTKIQCESLNCMYVGMFEDLTELKENKRSIHKLGNYDLLTNLPNQFLMRDRLTQAFLNADLKKRNVGFIYFDIDNFKHVNKYFDYSAGDKLICNVTARIFSELRSDYTFARISGDEFAIVIPDVINIDKVSFFAENIRSIMKKPFTINDTEYKISTSMGIAVYPADGNSTEEIIKNAHTALEYIKNNGKNNYHFYSSNLSSNSKRKLELSNDLKYAVDYKELSLVYQPKVNIFSHKIVGAEVLLRWKHTKYGAISPFEFIPIAEDNGEIINIGRWLIHETCLQMKKWKDKGLCINNIAINLSPIQFKNNNIVEEILDALKLHDLDPSSIEIEITESMLMQDIDKTITKLKEFKANGLSISIDDFGTGYSSLAYLKNFPVDKLKIDRTFVKDFPDKDDGAISKIIVNLAKSLNLDIIAEGVETEEQLNLMKSMYVKTAQGYYFYKPLSAENLEIAIKEKSAIKI